MGRRWIHADLKTSTACGTGLVRLRRQDIRLGSRSCAVLLSRNRRSDEPIVIEKFEPTSFEDAIRTCVAPIDDYLGELRVPIPDRVLRAALLFLEYNVQEIRGDSKDDFIEKSWFRFIYQTIHS